MDIVSSFEYKRSSKSIPVRIADKSSHNNIRLPKLVHWVITHECPLCCAHCFISNKMKQVRKNQWNLNKLKQLIDFLHLHGVRNIMITGGEPFINHNILSTIEYIKSKNMRLYLTSSLITLLKFNKKDINSRIKDIFNFVDSLSISFDYFHKHAFEKLYSGISYEEYIQELIISITESYQNLPITIQTVIGNIPNCKPFTENTPIILKNLYTVGLILESIQHDYISWKLLKFHFNSDSMIDTQKKLLLNNKQINEIFSHIKIFQKNLFIETEFSSRPNQFDYLLIMPDMSFQAATHAKKKQILLNMGSFKKMTFLSDPFLWEKLVYDIADRLRASNQL